MLISSLSGQRCQTIEAFDITRLSLKDKKCAFFVDSVLKQLRQCVHLAQIELLGLRDNTNLCVITVLKEYLSRTSYLWTKSVQSCLSDCNPPTRRWAEIKSRWLKWALAAAVIDISVFTAHSTRGANTSAAKQCDTPIHVIMKAAGWSNQSTFNEFYFKHLSRRSNMAQAIMDRFVDEMWGRTLNNFRMLMQGE